MKQSNIFEEFYSGDGGGEVARFDGTNTRLLHFQINIYIRPAILIIRVMRDWETIQQNEGRPGTR